MLLPVRGGAPAAPRAEPRMALRQLAVRCAAARRPPRGACCSRLLAPRRAYAAAPVTTPTSADEAEVVRDLRRSVEEHALLRHGDAVVACVSGGVDSVALLLALARLAPELALSLHVLHFNHGIRPESASEAELVRSLAARLGVPCHVRARQDGWRAAGVPAQARAWRRSEALALAAQLAPRRTRIALAHHADDQRDTLLLKLLRGAHLSRLRAMAPACGAFVRPLLGCSKTSLAAFVSAQGEAWAEDASNANAAYSRRNAVRLRLVPLLQQLTGGGLDARLADACHQSAALRAWLDATPQAWTAAHAAAAMNADADDDEDDDDGWALEDADADVPTAAPGGELDVASWLQLPELVRLDQLHAFVVASSRTPLSYASLRTLAARLQAPAQRPRWVAHVSAHWRLARTGDRAWMQRWDADADNSEEQHADVAVTRACGISIEHPRNWAVSVFPAEPAEAAASEALHQRTDGTTGAEATYAEAQRRGMLLHNVPLGAELQLRTRRNGDRFMPHWRQKAVKLTDFLRDAGVPLHVRDALPLLLLRGSVAAVYPAWAAASLHAPAASAAVAHGTTVCVRLVVHAR